MAETLENDVSIPIQEKPWDTRELPKTQNLRTDIEWERLKEDIKKEKIEFIRKLSKNTTFTESDVLEFTEKIQETSNKKYSLFLAIQKYFESWFFSWKDFSTFFDEKFKELELIWITEEEKNELWLIKWDLYKRISSVSKNILTSTIKEIWEDSLVNVSSIKIEKWKLILSYNNSPKIDVFTIEFDEKKSWFKSTKSTELAPTKSQEQVTEREKVSENNQLSFFWWVLTLSVTSALVKGISNLKTIEFIDKEWKLQKIKLDKPIAWDNAVLIKESLTIIERELGYKWELEWWKIVFEKKLEEVDISNIRWKIWELSFEDYKKIMADSWIPEDQLKVEFEKQKYNLNSFIDWVEKQYWKKVSFKDFSTELMKNSVSWKFWLGLHIILYPIFFTEILKHGWNLDSYFKWASEMVLFNSWAMLAWKGIMKIPWAQWKIIGWFMQLVWWIVWWWVWVTSWIMVAGLTWMQKWFDTVFPESEDFMYKYAWWKNDSMVGYLWTWWFAFEMADYLWTDIGIHWTPITFWQNEVDLSTDKSEYMSVWLTRNKESYNAKVDDFTKKLLDKIHKLTWDYKKYTLDQVDQSDWLMQLSANQKDRLKVEWRKKLEKSLYNFIFKWENGWEENTNKELKEKLYNFVLLNIDKLIEWTDISEIEWLIAYEMEKLKISKDTLLEMQREIVMKESQVKTVLSWDNKKQIGENPSYEEVLWVIWAPQYMVDYIASLNEKEREFLLNYYTRTINKEEVIWKDDYVDDVWYVYRWDKKVRRQRNIYDKLINDSTEVKLENWKTTTNWKIFHEITMMIKDLKRKKEFFDRLKKTDSITDSTKLKVWEKIDYTDWTEITKFAKWIEIVLSNKKMFLWTDENGKLEYIKIWDRKFVPDVALRLENKDMYPYVFINSNEPKITFRRQNTDINEKFVRTEDINIADLIQKTEWQEKFTLIEDNELYYDIVLKLDK